MDNIGARIGLARRKRGLGQDYLATACGKSVEWLRRVERNRGSYVIQDHQIAIIAKELGVSREWLAGDAQEGGPVNRRTFLRGAGALGAAAAIAPFGQLFPGAQPPGEVIELAGVDPIEHLTNVRRALVEADNLVGPRQVLPTVLRYIEMIQRLRSSGTDSTELLRMRARYAEFAAWLHQDAGDPQRAQYWLDRSLEWSHAVGDNEMATFILARSSQLAGDLNDALSAMDRAAAARRLAQPGTKLYALALTYGAHGYALAGQDAECQRALENAQKLLATGDLDPNAQWAHWLDLGYVEVHRARSYTALGVPARGIPLFQAALQALPATMRRDRGVYLGREALAYAASREPEQAVQVGIQALTIAAETQSGRIASELARLGTVLQPWRAEVMVNEFLAQVAQVVP